MQPYLFCHYASVLVLPITTVRKYSRDVYLPMQTEEVFIFGLLIAVVVILVMAVIVVITRKKSGQTLNKDL